MIPELSHYEGSWVVSRRDTGEVIGEFFDRHAVERFDPAKCLIETIGTYLGRVNAEIAKRHTAPRRIAGEEGSGMSDKRKQPRPVAIRSTGRAYFVEYLDRVYGGKHYAAQFDARHATLTEVRDWIAERPALQLKDAAPAPAAGDEG